MIIILLLATMVIGVYFAYKNNQEQKADIDHLQEQITSQDNDMTNTNQVEDNEEMAKDDSVQSTEQSQIENTKQDEENTSDQLVIEDNNESTEKTITDESVIE